MRARERQGDFGQIQTLELRNSAVRADELLTDFDERFDKCRITFI